MTNVLLMPAAEVVNTLPMPEWAFFLIPFAILVGLLLAVQLIGRTHPHS
ncbi:hypothetical protein [Raineyella fluvialis]|nr:hypothetical protein [Raineyella fluvialis]